jgi:NTE family protein
MPDSTIDLVNILSSDEKALPETELRDGTALCLSGGGYRAMVFHIGALWRLCEIDYLGRLQRISSVSGGSITAGLLAFKWDELGTDKNNIEKFKTHIVEPLRNLASITIDVSSILKGVLWIGNVGDYLIRSYEKHLFGKATLQKLPNEPRFVINATNVQTGALWRFSKPYMRDYLVGEVKNPDTELAVAVAASSAFPPVLSPVTLKLKDSDFTKDSGDPRFQHPAFTTDIILTDGGVYDNLGLETAWKNYKTILVSDGGGKMACQEKPNQDWFRHTKRVLDLIDNQVRSLRKRQVIDSLKLGARQGAYWGIRTNIQDYHLENHLICDYRKTIELANTPTRLKRLEKRTQERLINWGYAVCDTAIRTHVQRDLEIGVFPYPKGVE